jgi:hypothetical protein
MPPTPTVPCPLCGQLFKQENPRIPGCPDCMKDAQAPNLRDLTRWFSGFRSGLDAGMSAEQARFGNDAFSRGFRYGVGRGRRYIASIKGW